MEPRRSRSRTRSPRRRPEEEAAGEARRTARPCYGSGLPGPAQQPQSLTTSSEPEASAEQSAEFMSVEEEVESVRFEERDEWGRVRAALLLGWAKLATAADQSRVVWERKKAQEGADQEAYIDSLASSWTPVQQAEAREEGAAVARAAADERARWKALTEGVLAAMKAAIPRELA